MRKKYSRPLGRVSPTGSMTSSNSTASADDELQIELVSKYFIFCQFNSFAKMLLKFDIDLFNTIGQMISSKITLSFFLKFNKELYNLLNPTLDCVEGMDRPEKVVFYCIDRHSVNIDQMSRMVKKRMKNTLALMYVLSRRNTL